MAERHHLTPLPEIDSWRGQNHPTAPDIELVMTLVRSLRAGAPLAQAASRAKLPVHTALDVTIELGSKCAQMNKRGAKIGTVSRAASTAARAITERNGDLITVVAAYGWAGEDSNPDVRRAYAALLTVETTIVKNALAKWRASNIAPTMTYTHFADLHASSRKALPDLSLVVSTPTAAQSYLHAWEQIDHAVAEADEGAAHLISGRVTATSARAALRKAFWLVPQATHLDRMARTVEAATTPQARHVAETRLWRALNNLRVIAVRCPSRLRPRELSQLNTTQLRAIAALHGLHPADGANARLGGTLEGMAEAVEEARTKLAAQLGQAV